MRNYLTLLLAAGVCTSASAELTQVSNDALWPTEAVISSGMPGATFTLSDGTTAVIDYESERDVKDQRALTQTFTIGGAGYVISDLYFGYVGGTAIPDDVQIRIFEVDDVHGDGSDADDDQINGFPTGGGLNTVEIFNETITLTSLITAGDDPIKLMHVNITDGLTLPGRTGPAGYAISLYNPDTDGVLPFKWAIERSDPGTGPFLGPYLGGRPYSDNAGSAQETQDWAFAMDGVAVPEPSTFALLAGLATLALVMVRRRRK